MFYVSDYNVVWLDGMGWDGMVGWDGGWLVWVLGGGGGKGGMMCEEICI